VPPKIYPAVTTLKSFKVNDKIPSTIVAVVTYKPVAPVAPDPPIAPEAP
jgi:hypothetical protein